MSQYNITVSKEQLALIEKATEWYIRTSMGQFFDYCSEIALNGYEYDKSNPDNDRLFDEYIQRRNESQEMFDKAYNVAAPNLFERKKTQDVQNAIDIWHVIRYFRYLERPEPKDHHTVDAYPPYQNGSEPLPKVEKVEK